MCDEIDRQLGLRLRRRRRLLALTQQQLAARIGVRFQQVQKYESAANRMSAGMIGRIAHALGVEVGYFYAGLERLLAPQNAKDGPPPKLQRGLGRASGRRAAI
ncbi:MAG: XRE family transcriptional regulator [Phenylobacterium sp.]|uniref:helix-turn-helix domain-containing protein n=1 Tax=Phenylobacterium sp. TaxID=1871053 RepID=UPI001225E61A|nr:helix-turn-helix transcriptional regulator [Phenylobacterium sp.]TAJ71996.1 MAG: XRE family transcriptional regulator [Phenylobacterium sp.]